MTPDELCQLLDELEIPTTIAAKQMGISRVALEQYLNGKRYPSHGGGVITKIPKSVAILARTLKRYKRPL